MAGGVYRGQLRTMLRKLEGMRSRLEERLECSENTYEELSEDWKETEVGQARREFLDSVQSAYEFLESTVAALAEIPGVEETP